MNIVKKTSTIHTTYKPNRPIGWIVVHYTAGVTSKADSAVNLASYFATRPDDCSSDFTVDDTAVAQYNPDIRNRYTWHCGGNKYNNKGGKFYGICTNSNSIGIEVCSTNSTGKMQAANDKSYSFTDSVVKNTEELVKYLMKEYNIPSSHVIRHYDVNGKPCPGIVGWNAESGSEAKWEAFKRAISGTSVSAPTVAPEAKYYVQVGAFSVKENAYNYRNKVRNKYPGTFVRCFDGSELYFVQVGAFSSRENAENYLKEVKKTYPNAFIKVV